MRRLAAAAFLALVLGTGSAAAACPTALDLPERAEQDVGLASIQLQYAVFDAFNLLWLEALDAQSEAEDGGAAFRAASLQALAAFAERRDAPALLAALAAAAATGAEHGQTTGADFAAGAVVAGGVARAGIERCLADDAFCPQRTVPTAAAFVACTVEAVQG